MNLIGLYCMIFWATLCKEFRTEDEADWDNSKNIGSRDSDIGMNLKVVHESGTTRYIPLKVKFLVRWHKCFCSRRNAQCYTDDLDNVVATAAANITAKFKNEYFCRFGNDIDCSRIAEEGKIISCSTQQHCGTTFAAIGDECELSQVKIIHSTEWRITVESMNYGIPRLFRCYGSCNGELETEEKQVLSTPYAVTVAVVGTVIMIIIILISMCYCRKKAMCFFKRRHTLNVGISDEQGQRPGCNNMVDIDYISPLEVEIVPPNMNSDPIIVEDHIYDEVDIDAPENNNIDHVYLNPVVPVSTDDSIQVASNNDD